MKKKYSLFAILYLVVGFLPYLDSIDKIATQWTYLAIVNSLFTLWILTKQNIYEIYITLKESKQFRLFIYFFFISVCSLFVSINLIESFIEINRLLILIHSLACLIVITKSSDVNFIIKKIVFPILIVQLMVPLYKFFTISLDHDFTFLDANSLKTFTGNKNVLAALISCQIPLLTYIFNFKKNIFTILMFAFFSVVCSLLLIAISSRASILGIILSSVVSLSILLIYNINHKRIIYQNLIILSSVFIIGQSFTESSKISLTSRTQSINVNDTSTQERIRFLKSGLDSFLEHPFGGIGIGNWKQKSGEYEAPFMTAYIVPYHMHNDFLQYFVELGIIGGLLYLFIFYNLFKTVFDKLRLKINVPLNISLFGFLVIFFVDSNINFPHHRPVQMILLCLIVSIISKDD